MKSLLRLIHLRTALSALAMVALLIGGTYTILGKVIDRVADRHSVDLARSTTILLLPRPGDTVAARPQDTDGRVAQLRADDAAERQALRHDFMQAFFQLIFLLGCSFGVPAVAVLWRGWQKRRGDERIRFLVSHDPATGLLNRVSFSQSLELRLAAAAAEATMVAVHFIDIDRFKGINDTLGHSGGDELIAGVAARLIEGAAANDLIGRFGGDEFVFAQCDIAMADEALAKAEEIRSRLAKTFHLDGHDMKVTASIGLSVAPGDGATAVMLMHASDTAMYRAKAEGRDTVRVYEPEMAVKLQSRRTVEEALRRAMDSDGFLLHFQPVFQAQGEKLIGFEVLLRLPVPGGALIPPAVFIPIAEEMGIITKIGSWVIEQACMMATTWPEDLLIAVNLSPKQLENDEICDVVASALKRSGLAAHRLELEITEGVLLRDTETVISQLGKLKALGISIAMDDFGTGYSSLSNLWRFPFDKLKIDRSFMSNLSSADDNMVNILKTIVSLGRTLKLQVTAEGIETQLQADLLKSLNCDQLQGYHYGRPMPHDELLSVIDGSTMRAPLAAASSADPYGEVRADAA